MAADTPARFSATVQDEEGLTASVLAHLYIDGSSLVSAVATALNAWVKAIDGVTGGKIIRSEFAVNPALPGGIKGTADAGSEVS